MRFKELAWIALMISPISANAQNAPMPFVGKFPITISMPEKIGFYQEGQGDFEAAPTKPIGTNAALSSFVLGYMNGDHKMRGIGIMPRDTVVDVHFSDIDRNDPAYAKASWWNIPGAVGGIVDFPTGKIVSNQIPPGPPNSTLAIAGFTTWMQGYHDCKITRFEVGFNTTNDRMVINPGLDCNETKFLKGAYVYIPNSAIAQNHTITGNSTDRNKSSGTLPTNDRYVLRSFKIEFKNGSHHLLQVGINLDPQNFKIVRWQDNNQDDPIQWRVDYSVLK